MCKDMNVQFNFGISSFTFLLIVGCNVQFHFLNTSFNSCTFSSDELLCWIWHEKFTIWLEFLCFYLNFIPNPGPNGGKRLIFKPTGDPVALLLELMLLCFWAWFSFCYSCSFKSATLSWGVGFQTKFVLLFLPTILHLPLNSS